MNLEIRKHIRSINYHFDRVHYIQKRKRNLGSLYTMLRYNSERYKENIKFIQTLYSKRRNKPLKIHDRELVACAIAAKCKKNGVFGTSYEILQISRYNKTLAVELLKIGVIGKTSALHNTNNAVGACAEVKAANNILQYDKYAKIAEIEFTHAIRPRTLERMNRCNNCIAIFGHE